MKSNAFTLYMDYPQILSLPSMIFQKSQPFPHIAVMSLFSVFYLIPHTSICKNHMLYCICCHDSKMLRKLESMIHDTSLEHFHIDKTNRSIHSKLFCNLSVLNYVVKIFKNIY